MTGAAALSMAVVTGFVAAPVLAWARPRYRDFLAVATAAVSLAGVVGVAKAGQEGAMPALSLAPAAGLPPLSLAPDGAGLVFAMVAATLWVPAAVYAVGYLRANHDQRQGRFHAFFAMAVAAALGVALAGNLFTFLLFFEALTLVTWPLVVHRESDRARRAGRLYLAYTLAGGVCLLGATAWAWTHSPGLEFTQGGFLAGAPAGEVVGIGALLLLGVGVKAGLVGLHAWLPEAMVAPTPVSALLHAVAVVKAGVFGVARVALFVVGPEAMRESGLAWALALAAVATVVFGSLAALRADQLKRRLAYSTVSHLSYIVLGIALYCLYGLSTALVGAALHFVAHAVLKITLFMAAGSVSTATGKSQVSELGGVGRQMPVTVSSFAVAALGLVGIPPMIGFFSKFALVTGAVAIGGWWSAVYLAAGLLTAMYLLPIPIKAWAEAPPGPAPRQAGPLVVVPLAAAAALAVALGLIPLTMALP